MGKKSRKKQATPQTAGASSGRFANHRPLYELLLFGGALVGVLITAHMNIWWAFYDATALGAAGSECGIPGTAGGAFDCAAAFTSQMGTLLGVPNAVWGLLFFLSVAGLGVAVALGAAGRTVLFKRLRAGLIAVGFAYSLFLTAYQFVALPKTCLLCLVSAFITTLLFAVQAVYLLKPGAERPAPMASMKLYGGLAAVLLVLVAADFVYFNNLEQPVVASDAPLAELRDIDFETACRFDEEKPIFENFDMLVDAQDPYKGAADAPVTIIEYFDPNCPHCKTAYPILEDVARRHAEEVKVVYKPVALVGQQSFAQVAALHAAAETSNEAFFGMLERQFANQKPREGNGLDELRDFASDVGMDDDEMARRIRNGDFRETMRRQSMIFQRLGLTGVPAIIVEGRTIASRSRNVECLSYFIDEALQEEGGEASAPVETAAGEGG